MKISLLDYGLVDQGKSNREAILDSLRLVQEAEKLGYHRFWVAEHHDVPALSISAPEVVIPYLASGTRQIKIGSGGIMGLHYAPYKVAELATSLETLFPGRIDLGLGNSLGTRSVHQALESHYRLGQYRDWLVAFENYLAGKGETIRLVPETSSKPERFLLGMGGSSLDIAADLGLGYVYGIFPYIQQEPLVLAKRLSQTYRQNFKPSPDRSKPYFILAVFVLVLEDSQDAEEAAKALDLWLLGKQDFSEFTQFPSHEDVATYAYSAEDLDKIADNRSRLIYGDPQQIQEQLAPLLEACSPDELLFVPLMGGIDQRLKAIQLLANLYKGE